VIVAGVGFRSGAGADEMVALVRRALAEAGAAPSDLARLATLPALAGAAAFRDAARRLGVAPVGVDDGALRDARAKVRTHSPRALAAHGVGSVAEAAALGAAGRDAALLLERIASRTVTCALAEEGRP
jgi:cobalt-precorrin 5A hydrolase